VFKKINICLIIYRKKGEGVLVGLMDVCIAKGHSLVLKWYNKSQIFYNIVFGVYKRIKYFQKSDFE